MKMEQEQERLVFPPIYKEFKSNAITFCLESESEVEEEHFVDIMKIDVVYQPEFDQVRTKYKLPVFFKASNNHFANGFIDNGREIVNLREE